MPMRLTKTSACILFAAPVSCGILLYGCAEPADSTQFGTAPAKNPATAAKRPTTLAEAPPTVLDARPPALVNGNALYWDDLRPVLAELAGAEALQEVILNQKTAEALNSRGLAVTDQDISFERKLLVESLSEDANHAIRLLDELRDKQNLGKHRFDALLRRNASLRMLVKSNVKITNEAVQNMHELMHGPKRQARLMVLPNLEAAQAAINLVNSGVSFADVAVEVSVDASASRGGLLEPISRVDPNYPESIRQTLWSLDPGEISGPVLLEDRYAVLMLLKRVGGDGVRLEDARPALERMVRVQQERLLMDQLARRLVQDTQVTVFDEALNESWSRRQR